MDGFWNGFRAGGRALAGVRSRLIALPVAVCLLILAAGCGQAPVRFSGRPTGGTNMPLSGIYDASFSAPFLGTFTGRITAEPTREGFRANTRPGVAWALVGGVEEFLGPIFMPYLFPRGVILTWTSTLPAGGRPGEGWIGSGGSRQFGIRTLMDSPGGPVRFVLPDGRAVAMMTLEPARPHEQGAYRLVADRIEEAMRTRLFVPRANGKDVPAAGLEGYLAQVRSAAALAKDDIEFSFGAAMAARGNLKFFPLALRRMDPDAERVVRSWPEKDRATVRWTFDERSRVGTVSADVFLEAGDVDRAMEGVLDKSPRALVVDLRGCPGVELSALRVAGWLSEKALDAGTLYGRGGADGARPLTLTEAADFDNAGEVFDAAGAVRLVVGPVSRASGGIFSGPVVVLTNRRTAGSAEALVAVLKGAGRARVVGEPTAGRVVLSRPVDVGQGWLLRLPSAGWVGPDGGAVGSKGIEPDVGATGDAAMTRALALLSE